MNRLLELLSPENIVFDFKASSKEEVIEKLVGHLIATKTLELDEKGNQEIISSLLNREKSMSTGIGSGVAIPHCSIGLVTELKCAMAIAPQGIDFASLDDQPVQIFILLIVPKNKFQEHIKTLALIAKTLNIPEERTKIINCKTFEEIKNSIAQSN